MAKRHLLVALLALCPVPAIAQNIATPSAQPTYGTAPVVSAAAESCHVFKASPGSLYGFTVTTTGSATANDWILIYNAATAPADGTTAPVDWAHIGPNAQYSYAPPIVPVYFSTGITVCLSTTGPITKTGEAQAVFSGKVR